MKARTTIASALLSLGVLTSANSAQIITPSSIVYTGTGIEQGGLNLDDENNIINGNGLSAIPTILNVDTVTHAAVSFGAPGNVWATDDPAPGGGDYFADSGGAVLSFEIFFDQAYAVTDLVSWGYHFGSLNANDIAAVTLDYGVGDFAGGSTSVAIALGATPGVSVTSPVGSAFVADRLKLTVTDNQFGVIPNGGDRVGIAELRFIGAVPEPSTAALLGLGSLALVMVRRKG